MTMRTEARRTACVVGLNPSWQKTLSFETFAPFAVNRACSVDTAASGKGINFARACKHWGLIRPTVFQLAGGDTGKLLTRALDAERIEHVSVRSPAPTRVCTTVLCGKTHRMTELIEPSGAVSPLVVESLARRIRAALRHADGLALCGSFPPGVSPDFYAAAVAEARKRSLFVLLDAYVGISPAMEQGVDLLKINLDELRALTNVSASSDPFAVCFDLFPRLRFLAVTDGAEDAFFHDRKRLVRIRVPRVSSLVNPIGSGDTCSAVLLSEILTGRAPLDAFRRALAAASANCMSLTPASFSRKDALAFLRSMNNPV